jgi:hypothetical protein
VPADGAEGMILTSGGRFAGYGFYLLKGKPVFLWNMLDLERINGKARTRWHRDGIRSSLTSSMRESELARSNTTTSAALPSRAPAR